MHVIEQSKSYIFINTDTHACSLIVWLHYMHILAACMAVIYVHWTSHIESIICTEHNAYTYTPDLSTSVQYVYTYIKNSNA